MNLLLRSCRALRGAARDEAPTAEDLERRAERLSRRRFLQLSGAALGAAALPACGSRSGARDAVTIVGAGIAGLHCAYRLQMLGVRTTVYEASSRVGGRIFSDRKTFPEGMHCELGGELIDTAHRTMRDLAVELGIDLLDYQQDDPNLKDMAVYIDGRVLTEREILDGLAPLVQQVDAARATLLDPDAYVTYRSPNGAEALDRLSIREWLEQAGIPAADPVRKLVEAAYTAEYGLATDVSNSLNLILMLSTDATRLDLFGHSDERYHTRDGNDTFIRRLTEVLEPGTLEPGNRLVGLRPLSDGRYLLTFERLGGGVREVRAEHVVLALPFTLLRQVDLRLELTEVKRRAITELGYGANAKLMTGYSSRPWRTQHGATGTVVFEGGYESWDTSRMQPGASGIVTQFTGARAAIDVGHGTSQARALDFLEDFDRVFPGARAAFDGRAVRMHWPTHPFTQGSYSAYRVGQCTQIAGAEIERVGNLHFCGEHTSLDAQGFMEGGALTGAMAADEVAEDLGARVSTLSLPARRILARAAAARRSGRWLDDVRRRQKKQRAV